MNASSFHALSLALVGFFASKSLRGTCQLETLPRIDFLPRQKVGFRQLHLPFAFLFAIRHHFLQKERLEGAKSCDFERQ